MAKNRNTSAPIMAIPKHVMDHPDYYTLSGNGVKLLNEVAKQYTKHNNGKLCAVWSQLKERGFKSEATVNKAKKELLQHNLITLTKHGAFSAGGRQPHFYALTWVKIDDIPNFKMDVPPTTRPVRSFNPTLEKVAGF